MVFTSAICPLTSDLSSFHVPSADFSLRLRCSETASAIRRRDLPFLARQQRDVVVLPDNRQNFLAASALVEFEAHEKRHGLAGILHDDAGYLVFTGVLTAARDLQLHLG